jgi:hypothetical protein
VSVVAAFGNHYAVSALCVFLAVLLSLMPCVSCLQLSVTESAV